MSLISAQHLNHIQGNLVEAYNLAVTNNASTATLAVTGDATVGGTLGVTGATTLSGALGVTGATTLSGAVKGAVQALAGAGAVGLTTLITTVASTGAGTAYTLAAGTVGQVKVVVQATGATTSILTPSPLLGGTTITFNGVGEGAVLVYTGSAWVVAGVNGATIA